MSYHEESTRERTGAAALLARGVALGGLALAESLLLVYVGLVCCLACVGIGLPLLPGALDTVRADARLQRRLASRWTGIRVPDPYARPAAGGTRLRTAFRRLGEGATWRDLLWLVVNPVIGPVLGLVPALALLDGLFGLTLPFDWHTVTEHFNGTWFAFVPVHSQATAVMAAAVGLAEILLSLTVLPRLLVPLHGRWVRYALGTSRDALTAPATAPRGA